MKTLLKLSLIATTVLLSVPATATVVSGALTGGSAAANGGVFTLISPFPGPFSVGNDNFDDNNVRTFNELQGVTLLSSLTLDIGGTINSGTRVSSHYLVFDPARRRDAIGTVTFGSKVLGIATQNAALANSDFLGSPYVVYLGPTLRGLENTDIVSFSGNTIDFDFTASSPGDSIRILTAVPEPTTWAMFIAGFGMIGTAVRRRRSMGAAQA